MSEEEITMATMPSSSRVTMHGPPKIPKTPSKAINNMLESRCGKPFDSKAKAMVATVICGRLNAYIFIHLTNVGYCEPYIVHCLCSVSGCVAKFRFFVLRDQSHIYIFGVR